MKSALEYLIREKLLNFADAAEQHPEFARELPRFLAEVWRIFNQMESTAQYWKPVWQALEGEYRLHLVQAHSNRAPKGWKRDYADAERLVKRHVAGELILSFVPDA